MKRFSPIRKWWSRSINQNFLPKSESTWTQRSLISKTNWRSIWYLSTEVLRSMNYLCSTTSDQFDNILWVRRGLSYTMHYKIHKFIFRWGFTNGIQSRCCDEKLFFKFPSVFLLYLRRSLTNTTVATRHIDCIQITSRKRSDDKLVWLVAGKVTHFFKCFVSHSLNRPFLLLWIGIQYHSSSGSRPRVERNWTGNSVS